MAQRIYRNVKIEWYSGYRSEERPKWFWLGGEIVEIRSVISQWNTPDYRFFEVLGVNLESYLIFGKIDGWEWSVSREA